MLSRCCSLFIQSNIEPGKTFIFNYNINASPFKKPKTRYISDINYKAAPELKQTWTMNDV